MQGRAHRTRSDTGQGPRLRRGNPRAGLRLTTSKFMEKTAGGLPPAAFCGFRNNFGPLLDDFSTADRLAYGTFTPFGHRIGVKATFDGWSRGHALMVRGQDLTGDTLPRWSM